MHNWAFPDVVISLFEILYNLNTSSVATITVDCDTHWHNAQDVTASCFGRRHLCKRRNSVRYLYVPLLSAGSYHPCSLQSPVAPQPPSYRNDVHAEISLRNTCELLCEAGVQLCLSHRHELYTSLQKSRLHSIIEPVFDNLACRALSDLFFPRTRVATGQGLIYPDTEQTMSICSWTWVS